MSAGNITRRGAHSWRLKYEDGERDPATGKRQTRFVTVRGTKKEAQRELTRLLAAVDNGTAVDPSSMTVAEYVRGWLDGDTDLAPKTLERYRQLTEQQIVPHLGATILQKLRPAQVHEWHKTLLNRGGTKGGPLSARTVGHCHRLLHRGLERAVSLEIIGRNVAHGIHPPKVMDNEVEILDQDQITAVLSRLEGKELYPIVSLALWTGMRRGELCGLAWGAVDLEKREIRIERSLEQTKAGLRIKPPKTRSGRRTISLAASTVEMLRAHQRRQLEQRLLFGLGRPGDDDLVFARADGLPYPPDTLSRDWWRLGVGVEFHALRHTHASALIAARLDIVTVSKRLGHSSPTVTLGIYAHLFNRTDVAAAQAIEAAMGSGAKPSV
jgi:integrase